MIATVNESGPRSRRMRGSVQWTFRLFMLVASLSLAANASQAQTPAAVEEPCHAPTVIGLNHFLAGTMGVRDEGSEQALELLGLMLQVIKAADGDYHREHVPMAMVLSEMATTMRTAEIYEVAEALYLCTLSIVETATGLESTEAEETRNALADLYRVMGR